MSTKIAETRRRLGFGSAGISITPEEFDTVEDWDDRYRYELIRGLLVVSPPPGNAQVSPNQYLSYLLLSYREHHPQGSIIDESLPEQTLSLPLERRRCDQAIWTGLGRLPDPRKDVPTIIVEFVSASRRDHRRDYDEKRVEYATLGVAEYWVFDRFQRKMTVYRNLPGGPTEVVVGEADSYQTDLLPGFVLPPTRLLAKADDWPAKTRRRKPREGGSR